MNTSTKLFYSIQLLKYCVCNANLFLCPHLGAHRFALVRKSVHPSFRPSVRASIQVCGTHISAKAFKLYRGIIQDMKLCTWVSRTAKMFSTRVTSVLEYNLVCGTSTYAHQSLWHAYIQKCRSNF